MVKANDKARILLVDDEPRLIYLVREILGATGYEVLTAYSGEHAIEMVALEQPALILLDITLIGGDGRLHSRPADTRIFKRAYHYAYRKSP